MSDTTLKTDSLRTALKLDSVLCAVTGLFLAIAAKPLAVIMAPQVDRLFGLALSTHLMILGWGFVFVAAALYWVATRPVFHPWAIGTIIALDAVWIVDSLIVLLLGQGTLTLTGEIFIVLGAIAAAAFMVVEIRGLRQILR